MTPFQPNDRPIANSYHPNDAKLTLATDGLSTDRHFILRNTAPSGVYDYIVVSFHRLSVLGKSPLLDTFIETNNSRLFENEALENLSELHFRRMLGFFYGMDMDYIEDDGELAALYEVAMLFRVNSVANFCMTKLDANAAARWAARSPSPAPSSSSSSASSFSDYSDPDFEVLEDAQVEEENSESTKIQEHIEKEVSTSHQESRSLGKSRTSDAKTAAISTLKAEILTGMTASIKSEIKQELIASMKGKLKLAMTNNVHANIVRRSRIDGKFKYQLANEITATFRDEIKAKLVNVLPDKLKKQVRKGILKDKHFEDKLASEFDHDLREDLKWEITDELRENIRAKILAEVCEKD
ncbi:hypothetical protein Fcan01_20355 [Folsomia candida]|uniref:BTB domain-containing protein n=1 Tax=Folsomia candida TaxID=158441 RepID=A0A226DJV8_FOLCA|nr:hypothetical protein Fcan01_20355 [Folsomia candida]